MDSDFKTALDEATKTYDADLLRPALVRRTMYTFALAEDPETFVALVNGAIPNAIAWNNTIFWLDEADTTTPHDGVTVIRTSDDYCYKVEDIDMRRRSVLSFTTTAPPVSPSVGDSYLVPAGATGAWSSHQDDIATYTPRGWVFEVPGLGRQLQDEEVDGMLRYSATGWVYGYGTQAFDDDSIPYSASLGWGNRLIVENQSTTTPPTAVKGLRYVVGAGAGGAWSGKDTKIAICEVAGAWVFYTPEDGLIVFDKALRSDYRWSSATSAWISAAGSWVGRKSAPLTLSGSTTAPSGTSIYTYLNNTAPTTSSRRLIDTVTLAYAAKKTGAVLRFDYTADALFTQGATTGSSTLPVVIAIFRDSVVDAIAWKKLQTPVHDLHRINSLLSVPITGFAPSASIQDFFEVTAPDASSHTYTIAIISGIQVGVTVDAGTLERRLFTVQEAA
jgi:hypothetical protein